MFKAYVLDQTAELQCLRAIRLSDEEASPLPLPLPPFIWQTLFPPRLKYVEWITGDSSQIYHFERARVDVWCVEELSGVDMRQFRTTPDDHWTSESLFDHVHGEYRDHEGRKMTDSDLTF